MVLIAPDLTPEGHLLILDAKTKGGEARDGAITLAKGTSYALGRVSGCCGLTNSLGGHEILIHDDAVSRVQGRISPDAEGWTLHDHHSTQGIIVNGARIEKSRVLRAGDLVQIGHAQFLFREGPAEQSPTLEEMRSAFRAHTPARRLALIVAVGRMFTIGNAGKLPWNEPEDRAYFENTTRGHAVIMGRRTWEETGKPLEGRTNIVVSRNFHPPPGVHVRSSVGDAITLAHQHDALPFVIGGVEIFRAALAEVTEIHLTTVRGDHGGDRFFWFDRALFTTISQRESGHLRFEILERAR